MLEAHKPNYIIGFQKLHGSQHCVVKMLETGKNTLDKGDSVRALFMVFSKAFDSINHVLLLAEPKACGFSKDVLALICSYSKNCRQGVVIIIALAQPR